MSGCNRGEKPNFLEWTIFHFKRSDETRQSHPESSKRITINGSRREYWNGNGGGVSERYDGNDF